MNYKLILFDVDGTLQKTWQDELLPGVKEYFEENTIPCALITNQGGVGLRHWMKFAKFGNPDTMGLPYQNEVGTRITKLGHSLGVNNVYVSMAYQSKKTGEWSPIPENYGKGLVCSIGDNGFYKEHWGKEWRKPLPGMIIQAMRDNKIDTPQDVLMVGDRPEDEQAAQAAGVAFQWADEFFGRSQ